jgi:hypothetical protein
MSAANCHRNRVLWGNWVRIWVHRVYKQVREVEGQWGSVLPLLLYSHPTHPSPTHLYRKTNGSLFMSPFWSPFTCLWVYHTCSCKLVLTLPGASSQTELYLLLLPHAPKSYVETSVPKETTFGGRAFKEPIKIKWSHKVGPVGLV